MLNMWVSWNDKTFRLQTYIQTTFQTRFLLKLNPLFGKPINLIMFTRLNERLSTMNTNNYLKAFPDWTASHHFVCNKMYY